VERKLSIYFEASDKIDEEALFEHIHRFFCENPEDPNVDDCPLYAMTAQNVLD
jgi:hypothetical protein